MTTSSTITHFKNCVICIHAKATMMTAPCGHQVVCRKCFVKTIQIAVSQRLLPLRCVICRAKILRLKTGPVLPSSISGYSVNSRASSGSLLSSTASPSANNHQHTTTALLHPHHHRSSSSPHHLLSSPQPTAATSPSSSSASSSIGGGPRGSSSVSRGAAAGTSGLVPASDSLYSVSSGSTGSTVSSSTSASSSGSSGSSGRGSGRLTCCPCGSSGQGKGHHHCLGAYPRQPTSGSLRRSQQHAMKMRLQEYCRPSGGVGYLPPIKESAANSPIHGSCGQPATPPPSTRIRCAQKIVTQLESAPLLDASSSKSAYSIPNHRPSQFHKYTESSSSSSTKDSTSHKHISNNNNNNSSSTTKIFKGNKYSKLPNNNSKSEEATKDNLDVIRLASEEDCSVNNNQAQKKSSSKRWWRKKSKEKDDKTYSSNVTEKDDNKRNEQAEKQMEMMQKCKKDDDLMKESGSGKLRFRKGIAYTEEKL